MGFSRHKIISPSRHFKRNGSLKGLHKIDDSANAQAYDASTCCPYVAYTAYPPIPVSSCKTGCNCFDSRRNGWFVFAVYSANCECSPDAPTSSNVLRVSCGYAGLLYAVDSRGKDCVPASLQRMVVDESLIIQTFVSVVHCVVLPVPSSFKFCR
jgi:hypothetical protein